MWRRCESTVLGLKCRRWPISAVGKPWPISWNTSNSRSVKVPEGSFSGVALAPGKRVYNPPRYPIADVGFAPQHLANSQEEFVATFILHDVAVAAGVQHPLGIQGFVVHRDDNHEDLGRPEADVLEQHQAAAMRKRDVEQGKVRLEGLYGLEGLHGAIRFATHFQVFFLAEQVHQAAPGHGMIFNDEDATLASHARSVIVRLHKPP